IVKQLGELVSQLSSTELRRRVEPIVKEISEEISIGTLDRMATYRRFADDPQNATTADAKLALAISGWLLGADEATENFPLALTTVDVRNLIQAYLAETVKLQRDAILTKIQSQDAATPKLISALIAHMKPNLETPVQSTPGFFELTVPGQDG